VAFAGQIQRLRQRENPLETHVPQGEVRGEEMNSTTNDIKTLIFDFGGVLLDLNMPACLAAFQRLGCGTINEYIDHYKQNGLFLDFEEGKISTADFFEELQKIVGNNVAVTELENAYLSFLGEVPPYKLDLLLQLRKKYRVLMLSNINAFVFDYCKKTHFEKNGKKINDYFDKVYLSYEIGICKPDRRIFDHLIADARLVPQHCLYIDDGEKNIETARTLGFATYLAKPQEDFSYLFEMRNVNS
jgi:putative hydrolase of the HAD superfamily